MSAPSERTAKRMKGEGGPPPPEGYHGYGAVPPGGRYHQYGGPPMGPQSGYMGWQHGQYPGGGPPPYHASGPPGAMYPPQRGAPTPDRAGYPSGYARGPPPPMAGSDGRRPKPVPSSRGGPPPKGSEGAPVDGPPGGYPPSSGWQGGPYGGYQHGAPPVYGGGPPPGYGYRAGHSPPRSRPRSSPEMMSAFPGGPGIDTSDMDMYTSRGVGPDDDGSTGGGASSKDKGRGSYKCGRCGVPKKGHVCPYQPKLTRRPGEPLPEMRSAAVQVEMDEFMTLRRLNLKIQGFPESYATEPYMDDDMVVGEPAHPPIGTQTHPPPPHMTEGPSHLPADPTNSIVQSPIRSSPVTEDPITA